MLNFLNNTSSIINCLGIISFIVGIGFFIIALVKYDVDKSSFKIGGAFIISALSFLANTSLIYALTIFLIATFITKLDFLENLAAIFWNREKFWDYRLGLLAKATPKEKDDKFNLEVEEVSSSKNTSMSVPLVAKNLKEKVMKFEKDVIKSLESSNTFIKLTPNVKFVSNDSPNFKKTRIIDTLGQTNETDYMIDIKYALDKRRVESSIHKIISYIELYKEYMYGEAILIGRPVKGIIVIPAKIEFDNFVNDNIAVLKFDEDSKEFTNLDKFKEWVK